jgi:ribosomal protein S19E (S16A)
MSKAMIDTLTILFEQAEYRVNVPVDTTQMNKHTLSALASRGYVFATEAGMVVTPAGAALAAKERQADRRQEMADMFRLMLATLTTLYKQAENKIDVPIDPSAIERRVLDALLIRGYVLKTDKGMVITRAGAAWLKREAQR